MAPDLAGQNSQPDLLPMPTNDPSRPAVTSPRPILPPSFVSPPVTPATTTPSTDATSLPPLPPLLPLSPALGLGASSVSNDQPRSATTGLLEALPQVRCLVRARIPTVSGTETWLHLYENSVDAKDHLAIVFGPHIRSRSLDAAREGETEFDRMVRGAYTGRLYPGRTESGIPGGEAVATDAALAAATPIQTRSGGEETVNTHPPLVRIHSECYTGETAWSARCDCGEQLDEAARLMSLPAEAASGGIIIYLRQEGRGIGLVEKLKAYNLQDLGSDTVEANLLLRHPADARSYGLATAMLLDLGQPEVRLLTNNPDKVRAVEGPNREVRVQERVPMVPLSWASGGGQGFRSKEVEGYLKTKIEKMGHMLDLASMPR